MASYQSFNHPNQVRVSYSSNIRHGHSKAQTSLNKILHIISSFPPCDTSKNQSFYPQFDCLSDESRSLCFGKRGFGIDLNLRQGPFPEIEESESPAGDVGLTESSAVGTVVESNSSAAENSSEGECEPKEGGRLYGRDFPAIDANRNGEDIEVVGEKATEASEITSLQVQSFEVNDYEVCEKTEVGEESKIKVEEEHHKELQGGDDGGGVKTKSFWRKQCRSNGFLGLLIEAAELISGEFEDDEPEPERSSRNDELEHEHSTRRICETEMAINESMRSCSKSKRNQCWLTDLYGDFEDISPVVRSKRGRSQVLPHRYRDSVLEPWRPLSRQRSTTVSTTRRSR